MARRAGERRKRDNRKRQKFRMKYYLIVTDAEKTEIKYFNGLKESLPDELKDKISIQVRKAKSPHDLINVAKEIISKNPQTREVWLVFDRDQVNKFDTIVEDAKNSGFNVGWSNPCIEIWFHSYFGEIPKTSKSKTCISNFSKKYEQLVGQKYSKNSSDIYIKLKEYGNEETAINISRERLSNELENDENCKPSEMYGTTRVFELVEEINNTRS
ncbi:MAG: RloB family protein [Neofamilia sp.]